MSAGGPAVKGPFYRWLVDTQVRPAFRRHSFLERAEVFVVPRPWLVEPAGQITQLMIFYGASRVVDLDATLEALARDAQDPNLPPGVSNYDLYAPCDPPFAFYAREALRGAQRDPEHGVYEALDAFAVYASFTRGSGDDVVCLRADTKLCAMIDRVVPG